MVKVKVIDWQLEDAFQSFYEEVKPFIVAEDKYCYSYPNGVSYNEYEFLLDVSEEALKKYESIKGYDRYFGTSYRFLEVKAK